MQKITEELKKQIYDLAEYLRIDQITRGDWGVDHIVKSRVFLETKMHTRDINCISVKEAKKIIAEMEEEIEEREQFKKDHPACANGCDIEYLGLFDGMQCRRCGTQYI